MRLSVAVLAVLAVLPASALADPQAYLPPAGRIWDGVTAGASTDDFRSRTGKQPAVWQQFIAIGGNYQYALRRVKSETEGSDPSVSLGLRERAGERRVMLHLSTTRGQNQPESVSPGEIAAGARDGWLTGLTRDLAALGAPAYVRPFGEMNNCNNAYAALNCDGSRRDAAHSPAQLKAAWKRMSLILHGGPAATINGELRALGLPALRVSADALPQPRVALMWTPMTGGSPLVPALAPNRYWPGSRWVDWVGTSFYSRFPNWVWLERFYRSFAVARRKPFAIAEWALWGADDPSFARRLMTWARSRRRVRMVQYNQGDSADGPFRLVRYPRSQSALRAALASPRFQGAGP